MTSTRYGRLRAGLLSAALVLVPAGTCAATVQLALRTGRQAVAAGDPAGVLLALAALSLGVVLAWAGAAAAAGVVEAWTPAGAAGTHPGRAATSAAPGRGRTGVVSAGVAALVVAALAAPAAAASPEPPPVVVAQQVDADPASADAAPGAGAGRSAALSPAPLPGSWAALVDDGFRAPRGGSVGAAALVSAPPSRAASAGPATEVVVLAGDSLWAIAERHLGPGADATEVAEAWPRWWDANRSVVGDDPHLLLPGQRLVAPPP